MKIKQQPRRGSSGNLILASHATCFRYARPEALPDGLAVFVTEDEGFAAAGDFPGKNRFHTFKLHLRANHSDRIALVKDQIVSLYKLRAGEVDLNRLVSRKPQDQM